MKRLPILAATVCLLALVPAIVHAASAADEMVDIRTVVTVRIGHVGPMRGPIGHLGVDNERGARLAVEELNLRGLTIGGQRAQFELLTENDDADPQAAVAAAKRLVKAQVVGVIGHLNSSTTIPASHIYAQAGIPHITPSATNPTYTRAGTATAFRLIASDVEQGRALGRYVAKVLKARRVAIVDDGSAYGATVADLFAATVRGYGVTAIARLYVDLTRPNFEPIVKQIKRQEPDLVFYGGMDAEAVLLLAEMRKRGLRQRLVGPDGIQTAMVSARPEAEGTIATQPGSILSQKPGIEVFGKAYKNRFKDDIQIYAPEPYDAVMLMAEAMSKAHSIRPKEYLPYLKASDHQGVSGRIRFDSTGDLIDAPVTFYRVEDGAWKYIATCAEDCVSAK